MTGDHMDNAREVIRKDIHDILSQAIYQWGGYATVVQDDCFDDLNEPILSFSVADPDGGEPQYLDLYLKVAYPEDLADDCTSDENCDHPTHYKGCPSDG